MTLRISAPGKTIVMGEHSAVYGCPALVAAIDRRLTVRVDGRDDGVTLDLPQLGVREETGWGALRRYAAAAGERWRTFDRASSVAAFRDLQGGDPAHVVKVALGETAERLQAGALAPATVRIDSEIPIGAGFGSSAATAVATVAACLEWAGRGAAGEEVDRLAVEVERRQHGRPSGVDNAAVRHGGLVWAEGGAGGERQVEPLKATPDWLRRVRVFNTGTPRESTGEVVAAVRERLESEPAGRRWIERMEASTRALYAASEAGGTTADPVVRLFRDFEECLERLGVVPRWVRQLVRAVEARGGAAKVSGAGGLSEAGAGSLLVYHPEPAEIARWSFLAKLESLDVRLGAEGLRHEG